MTAKDYHYNKDNIPEIRILEESPFWSANLEEERVEEEAALSPEDSESEEDVSGESVSPSFAIF